MKRTSIIFSFILLIMIIQGCNYKKTESFNAINEAGLLIEDLSKEYYDEFELLRSISVIKIKNQYLKVKIIRDTKESIIKSIDEGKSFKEDLKILENIAIEIRENKNEKFKLALSKFDIKANSETNKQILKLNLFVIENVLLKGVRKTIPFPDFFDENKIQVYVDLIESSIYQDSIECRVLLHVIDTNIIPNIIIEKPFKKTIEKYDNNGTGYFYLNKDICDTLFGRFQFQFYPSGDTLELPFYKPLVSNRN